MLTEAITSPGLITIGCLSCSIDSNSALLISIDSWGNCGYGIFARRFPKVLKLQELVVFGSSCKIRRIYRQRPVLVDVEQ